MVGAHASSTVSSPSVELILRDDKAMILTLQKSVEEDAKSGRSRKIRTKKKKGRGRERTR
tara:strand:- start:187 stop:366 length:180 start_codon:yes stop_codon:yes gene_type:complete